MSCGCNEDVKKPENAYGKVLNVDFLFLDEKVCAPCGGTGQSLSQAVEMLREPLMASGIDLQITKIHVADKNIAIAEQFLSSPTIRINGKDIDPARTEDDCPSCASLTGDETPVTCRTWHWRGEVYQAAPLGKIIEEIMSAALVSLAQIEECCDDNCCIEVDEVTNYALPENLERFFAAQPEHPSVSS